MGQHKSEGPRLVEAAYVGQLDKEQECRSRGLEPGDDRMRRVFEQRADFQQAKKGLENSAQKITEKKMTRINTVP